MNGELNGRFRAFELIRKEGRDDNYSLRDVTDQLIPGEYVTDGQVYEALESKGSEIMGRKFVALQVVEFEEH